MFNRLHQTSVCRRAARAATVLLVTTALALTCGGCDTLSGPPGRHAALSPDSPSVEDQARDLERKQQQADDEYLRAAEALAAGDTFQAEQMLNAALTLNPYHGAAHNDLGMIYFRRGNLHEAAVHFDAAAKSLVTRLEPHYNLGMVWEAAGRHRDAADAYAAALRLSPDDLNATENLARVLIRTDTRHRDAIRLLEAALARETRREWRDWMMIQLTRLRGIETEPTSRVLADTQPGK